MKKIICMLTVLVLCLCMSVAAFADEFVPSISYKDGPRIVRAEQDDKDVTDCLVVSTVQEAEDQVTDITQYDRDLLLEVYEKLMTGEMTLPLEKEYVIRDLVDVSYKYENCRTQESHGNKPEALKEVGKTLTITFDMDLAKDEKIIVLTYIENPKARTTEGEWVPAENVVNNGDGTLTVEFEDICPVAFVVERTADVPVTGDAFRNNIVWIAVALVASAAGIVALIVLNKKKN